MPCCAVALEISAPAGAAGLDEVDAAIDLAQQRLDRGVGEIAAADQESRDRHRVDRLRLARIGVGRQRHRHQVRMAGGQDGPLLRPSGSSLMPGRRRRFLQGAGRGGDASRSPRRPRPRPAAAGRQPGRPPSIAAEVAQRHAAGRQHRLGVGARAGARLAELDPLALQVGDAWPAASLPWSRSGSARGTGCPTPAARPWRRPRRTAPSPCAAMPATSFWIRPTSASFWCTRRAFSTLPAVATVRASRPCPASWPAMRAGHLGVLAARLAAGEHEAPGPAGRGAAASSPATWPAPRRRSRCAARAGRRHR